MRSVSLPMPSVRALLPHHGAMVLLDEVLRCDEREISVHMQVRSATPYSLDDGCLPASVGLEIMGQAVAAWAGWQAHQQGLPVKLGFLLGTRRYQCAVKAFQPGWCLRVGARQSLDAGNGMSVFECTLEQQQALEAGASTYTMLAQAHLNVFQPPRAEDYFQEPVS